MTQLTPPAGPVPTWTSDDQVWIRAPLSAAPHWRLNHVADATAVDAMTEPPYLDQDADQFWAWIDQQAGTVRARVFAARYGVPQHEACGSASMLLAAQLGRAITIQHGRGSLVQASPTPNGMADLGGASSGTTSVPSISHDGPTPRSAEREVTHRARTYISLSKNTSETREENHLQKP